jgi:non-specific serine/threonine protein kinase/serine/threonine-protein kinase
VHNALRSVPGATESRRLLLDRAVQFLDGLAADAGEDDELQLELAAGYLQLANVQGNSFSENVGDTAAAVASLEKAARFVDAVRSRRPEDADVLISAINVYFDLAAVRSERGHADAAQTQARHESLVRELEQRHSRMPRAVAAVAKGYSDVGRFQTDRGDFDGAERAYREAVRMFEAMPGERPVRALRDHAFALKRLGAVLLRAEKYDESEQRYRQALALDEASIRLDDRPATRYDITFTLSDLALVQSRRGEWRDAVTMWQRALEIRRAAADADPKDTRALIGVATLFGRLGGAALAQQDPATSVARYREELGVRDRVISMTGRLPARVSEQAWSRLNLAQALLDSAAAAPRHPDRGAWLDEARRLVHSTGRGDGKISVTAGSEPGFLELHDLLTGRLAGP